MDNYLIPFKSVSEILDTLIENPSSTQNCVELLKTIKPSIDHAMSYIKQNANDTGAWISREADGTLIVTTKEGVYEINKQLFESLKNTDGPKQIIFI